MTVRQLFGLNLPLTRRSCPTKLAPNRLRSRKADFRTTVGASNIGCSSIIAIHLGYLQSELLQCLP